MADLDPVKQRAFALEVLQKLRAAGHVAYWAGGCVRDQILERTPKDYDVATSARPEQIRAVFGTRRTLEIGAAFGVIGLFGPPGAGQIEIATFRSDGVYSDGRRPDAVSFCEPEEDACRRDFTINGLFYDPLGDEVVDYVGGQEDLARGVVRAIGVPHDRFVEDKLRMLRAVRFAATFDFALDPATLDGVRAMAGELHAVSVERVAHELRLMLVHDGRVRAVQLLRESGLLGVILPEALAMFGVPQGKRRNPGGDLWDHTLLVLSELKWPSFPLALAALLHDVGKPGTMNVGDGKLSFYDHELAGERIADDICLRLKLANHERDRVTWLVRHHSYLCEARKMRWSKLQRMLTAEGIADLLDLHEADAVASGAEVDDVNYCRRLLRQPPEELNPPQLLTGHDLISHGVPQGPQYKAILDKVRDAQLERTIRSKRDALALVDKLMAED